MNVRGPDLVVSFHGYCFHNYGSSCPSNPLSSVTVEWRFETHCDGPQECLRYKSDLADRYQAGAENEAQGEGE